MGLQQQVSISDEVVFEGLTASRIVSARVPAQVCAAIVDATGGLLGFVRQTGAFLVSPDLAIDKAWTAAGFRVSTRELGTVLDQQDEQTREGLLARPRVTCVPGGLPIIIRDRCLGAVGVSGGSAEQDEGIAAAMLAAIEEAIK